MIYLFFTLFILYTIASCMDGPDLKPLWKKWLGEKLYHKAKYFWPELTYMFAPIEPPKIEYYHTDYKPIKLRCYNRISELDLINQAMHDLSYKNIETYCITRAREKCIDSLISNLKHSGLIEMQVNKDPYNASIDVTAELKILGKSI